AAMVLRAVRAARRGQVVGGPALAVACGLFAVGAVALAASRARAADAEQPLTAEEVSILDSDTLKVVPRVTGCGKTASDIAFAPILRVGDGLRLDGRKLEGYEQLNDDLVTLWNNHRLLHPSDDRSQPVLLVVADAREPLAPFLVKWRALKSQYQLKLLAVVPR